MSFVSIVATKDFVNIVGDGLVTNVQEDGSLITVQENYEKFIKIAENQFIAFAGNEGVFNKIKDTILFNPNGYDLLEMAQMLRQESNNVPFELARIMMAVGGLSKDKRKVEFYTISNRGDDFQHYAPKNDEIAYAFLVSSFINDSIYIELDEVFRKFLKMYGYNKSNKVLKAQKDLNMRVDKLYPTVNNKTTHLAIKK